MTKHIFNRFNGLWFTAVACIIALNAGLSSSVLTASAKEIDAGVDELLGNRHEKALSGTPREEAAVRSATDSIREARKNLSQAAGKKYVEIKPERVAAVPSER